MGETRFVLFGAKFIYEYIAFYSCSTTQNSSFIPKRPIFIPRPSYISLAHRIYPSPNPRICSESLPHFSHKITNFHTKLQILHRDFFGQLVSLFHTLLIYDKMCKTLNFHVVAMWRCGVNTQHTKGQIAFNAHPQGLLPDFVGVGVGNCMYKTREGRVPEYCSCYVTLWDKPIKHIGFACVRVGNCIYMTRRILRVLRLLRDAMG